MFRIMYENLRSLILEKAPEGHYEPDDVFDTHGLWIDLGESVEGLTYDQFREAAMERLEMPEMFCDDCGEVPGGKIEPCPDHLNQHVETMKSWGE